MEPLSSGATPPPTLAAPSYWLPAELWALVAVRVPEDSLAHLALTCRAFRDITRRDDFWAARISRWGLTDLLASHPSASLFRHPQRPTEHDPREHFIAFYVLWRLKSRGVALRDAEITPSDVNFIDAPILLRQFPAHPDTRLVYAQVSPPYVDHPDQRKGLEDGSEEGVFLHSDGRVEYYHSWRDQASSRSLHDGWTTRWSATSVSEFCLRWLEENPQSPCPFPVSRALYVRAILDTLYRISRPLGTYSASDRFDKCTLVLRKIMVLRFIVKLTSKTVSVVSVRITERDTSRVLDQVECLSGLNSMPVYPIEHSNVTLQGAPATSFPRDVASLLDGQVWIVRATRRSL